MSALFDRGIFKADKNRLIVNIGGITNLTYLSDKGIVGFDTGPGNCLIDAWSRKNGIGEFDDKGEWARSGEINQELLGLMLEDDYFKKKYPKSTGPDYFSMDWLLKLLEKLKSEILEWLMAFSHMAYTPMSDKEFSDYSDFSKSELGIALNKALFSVYNEMAKDQSQRLASILGEFMKSEDL